MPTPSPQAHRHRHQFREAVGRIDLQKRYEFFADRLHVACFCEGMLPHEEGRNRWLDEVGQSIEDNKAGI
jgi:hypothetical protein